MTMIAQDHVHYLPFPIQQFSQPIGLTMTQNLRFGKLPGNLTFISHNI